MRVGIDASNLLAGGGVTHLAELLRHADPRAAGFERVIVWGARATLDQLEPRPWLEVVPLPELERGLMSRVRWQRRRLDALARESCDILFVPGGSYGGSFAPFVTMCQNMLPFQFRERARYIGSWNFVRLTLLHFVQSWTFRRADAVIFLNDYAIERAGRGVRRLAVVPHGVSEAFRCAPREQRPLEDFTFERPFRFLYTSIIDLYKHQWNVARAVIDLREAGLPVALDLVGPAYPPAMRPLERVLRDDRHGVVRVRGPVRHAELPALVREADAFVFASSCENMPNVVVEAMAGGLPIASSRRDPMPRLLGDGAIYFDPERPDEIARALRTLAADPSLRSRLAAAAHARAAEYSWERCARETFACLADVANARRAESIRMRNER